jgi:hypothetical protein
MYVAEGLVMFDSKATFIGNSTVLIFYLDV